MNRIFNDPDQVVEDMLHGCAGRARRPGGRRTRTPAWCASPAPRSPARWAWSPAAARATSRPSSATSGENLVRRGGGRRDLLLAHRQGLRRRLPGRQRRQGRGLPVRQLRRRQHEREDGHQAWPRRRASRSRPSSPTTTCPPPPGPSASKRRGVAGEILMWKVGGARAAMGGTLDEVIAAAQKAIDNTPLHRHRPLGLHHPGRGQAQLPHRADGKMEVGIGHHGEPGIKVMKTTSANEMADLMLDTVLPDLPFERGRRGGAAGVRPGRHPHHGALHPLRPAGPGAGRRRGSRSASTSSATTSPPSR